MPKLRCVHHLLVRRRRLTALVTLLLVLGLAGLQTHAALPDHHFKDGKATMCIATLGAVAIAVVLRRQTRRGQLLALPGLQLGPASSFGVTVDRPDSQARASPGALTILRL